MACAVNCGRKVLYLVNTIFLLLGLAVSGFCVFLLTSFNDLITTSKLVDTTVLYSGISLGVAIVLFSVLGFVGACKLNRCVLLIYAVFALVAVIVQFALGAAVVGFTMSLGALENSSPKEIRTGGNKVQIAAEIAVNHTYAFCCPVSPLVLVNTTGSHVRDDLCKILPVDACTNGYANFRMTLLEVFRRNQIIIGGVVLGMALVQFIALVCGCHVLCHAKRHRDMMRDYEFGSVNMDSHDVTGYDVTGLAVAEASPYTNVNAYPESARV